MTRSQGKPAIIVSFLAGVALGIYLVGQTRGKGAGDELLPGKSEVQIACETRRLGKKVEEFDSRIRRLDLVADSLERSVDSLLSAMSSRPRKYGSRSENLPIAAEQPAVQPPAGWESILDTRISALLIEHGLTPYDPGVSELVRKCAEDLRTIRKEYDDLTMAIHRDFVAKRIDDKTRREKMQVPVATCAEKRRMTLEKLRTALEKLLEKQ